MLFSLDPGETKNRKTEIELILKPAEGGAKESSTGLVDKGLFTGDNSLFAHVDPETMLWTLRYKKGALPPALRAQRFTSYNKLFDYVSAYYKTRNVEITRVID